MHVLSHCVCALSHVLDAMRQVGIEAGLDEAKPCKTLFPPLTRTHTGFRSALMALHGGVLLCLGIPSGYPRRAHVEVWGVEWSKSGDCSDHVS